MSCKPCTSSYRATYIHSPAGQWQQHQLGLEPRLLGARCPGLRSSKCKPLSVATSFCSNRGAHCGFIRSLVFPGRSRPRKMDDVAYQEEAVRALKKAMETGNVRRGDNALYIVGMGCSSNVIEI